MAQFTRLLLTLGIMLFASVANAQNSVYIDQIGSNSTIDVTQTGTDNKLGDNTNKTILYGNTQLVTISQVGSYNTSAINAQGNNLTLTSNVTGDSNQVNVACGATGGAGAACNDTTVTATATGSSNIINVTGNGKGTIGASVNGDTNTVNVTSRTTNLNGSVATVTQTGGNANTINVTQDGPAGLNGFVATVDVTGGGNSIGVTQGGTIDSTVNIKSVGSNNSITVHSSN
jgi:hypothetical protein